MTDEGDLVTISGSTEVDATSTSLRHRSRTPEGNFQMKARYEELSAERDFNLTVEGDPTRRSLPTSSGFWSASARR